MKVPAYADPASGPRTLEGDSVFKSRRESTSPTNYFLKLNSKDNLLYNRTASLRSSPSRISTSSICNPLVLCLLYFWTLETCHTCHTCHTLLSVQRRCHTFPNLSLLVVLQTRRKLVNEFAYQQLSSYMQRGDLHFNTTYDIKERSKK